MKTYHIKKNEHSSGLHISPFFKNKLSFCAQFTSSCLYNLGTSDQMDINKLMGFSRGLHHKNSARIGWRAKSGVIELVSYCYVDGKRLPEEILATVIPGEKFCCTIKDIGNIWMLQVQTATHFNKIYVKKTETSCFGYMLFPYFGGNIPAPHAMKINIEIQK